MIKEFEIIEREQIFKGKILNVVKDTVKLPNGKIATREMVLHNGASAVIPIDDEGKIYLVEQYRHPIQTVTLEIPAGLLEPNELPMECAARELEEETGYKADFIEPLFTCYSAIGFSNEKIHVYLAKNLKKGKQNLDEDEFVNVIKVPLKEAVDMIYTGKIIDAKTISAVLAVYNLK